MYSRRLQILLSTITILALSSPASAQSVTGTCLPNDSTAARLVDFFKAILSPTTISDTVVRRKLGLTTVSANQVSVITAEPACTSAAVAVDANIDTKRTNYPLYVIALGSKYGVSFARDPGHGPGFAYVFDANWNLVRIINTF